MSHPAIAWSSGPAISLLSAPRWTPRADGCSTPESTARYGISPWSYSPARHGEGRTQPRDVELQGTHFSGVRPAVPRSRAARTLESGLPVWLRPVGPGIVATLFRIRLPPDRAAARSAP